MLAFRMGWVGSSELEGIAENRHRLVEVDAVLDEVGGGLPRIPFDLHTPILRG